jgi:hypothetical protein
VACVARSNVASSVGCPTSTLFVLMVINERRLCPSSQFEAFKTVQHMACVRGRCPCWPQAEPFDAAELRLLDAMRAFLYREGLWAKIQAQALFVRPHRRGYVLSTIIGNKNVVRTRTLIGRAHSKKRMQWLLGSGVCPNVSAAYQRRDTPVWRVGNDVHPGRPRQNDLWSTLQDPFVRSETRDLLLAAGAYPGIDTVTFGHCLAMLQRQWHAWHGRASRRLWAAAVL